MKADIHPKYHKIKVKLPKGDTFETYSTYPDDKLHLDVDYRKHPAWTKKGVATANESNIKISKFNKKFGDFNFSVSSSKKSAPQPAPVQKEDIAEEVKAEVKEEVANEVSNEPAQEEAPVDSPENKDNSAAE